MVKKITTTIDTAITTTTTPAADPATPTTTATDTSTGPQHFASSKDSSTAHCHHHLALTQMWDVPELPATAAPISPGCITTTTVAVASVSTATKAHSSAPTAAACRITTIPAITTTATCATHSLITTIAQQPAAAVPLNGAVLGQHIIRED
ncbi:hypothetical protein Pelo_4642 [Pelomyxa schiedti]|nr:hypothetical protein Pelo_4642 [Pelomyxa schiedti]